MLGYSCVCVRWRRYSGRCPCIFMSEDRASSPTVRLRCRLPGSMAMRDDDAARPSSRQSRRRRAERARAGDRDAADDEGPRSSRTRRCCTRSSARGSRPAPRTSSVAINVGAQDVEHGDLRHADGDGRRLLRPADRHAFPVHRRGARPAAVLLCNAPTCTAMRPATSLIGVKRARRPSRWSRTASRADLLLRELLRGLQAPRGVRCRGSPSRKKPCSAAAALHADDHLGARLGGGGDDRRASNLASCDAAPLARALLDERLDRARSRHRASGCRRGTRAS